jgi:hypothetical protein
MDSASPAGTRVRDQPDGFGVAARRVALLDEVDFFRVHASENADYRDFIAALVNTVVKVSGRDCFWARALPRMVAEQGLSNVSGG